MKKVFGVVSSNTISLNKGVSVKKNLLINDLETEMLNLYYKESFGIIESSEFYSNEEYSIHTEEYLMNGSKPESVEDIRNLEIYTKVICEINGINELDGEVAQLIAAQKLDEQSAPNARLHSDDRSVYITVQRRFPGSNWFNAKKNGEKLSIKVPVESIFNMDENGNIESFKMDDHGNYQVAMDMESMGHQSYYISKSVNKETQELEVVFLDQRVLLSSVLFVNGLVFENQQVTGCVAPFNYTVDHKTKEISEKRTSYAYDQIVEIGEMIALLPSDADMTLGEIASKEYDEGIMTGSSVSTLSMLMDDMQKQELAASKKEERTLDTITKKTRIGQEFKKLAIATSYSDLLDSETGMFASILIEDSYSKDKAVLKSVYEKLQSFEDKDLLKKTFVAYKVVNGRGLSYGLYRDFQSMMETPVRKEIATNVDKATVSNISRFNKGELEIKQLTDENIVCMMEAALKYRKVNKACEIKRNYQEVKTRYCQIKGVKLA